MGSWRTLTLACVSMAAIGCRDASTDPNGSATSSEVTTGETNVESSDTSANTSSDGSASCAGTFGVSGPGQGFVYVDGRFAGITAPGELE